VTWRTMPPLSRGPRGDATRVRHRVRRKRPKRRQVAGEAGPGRGGEGADGRMGGGEDTHRRNDEVGAARKGRLRRPASVVHTLRRRPRRRRCNCGRGGRYQFGHARRQPVLRLLQLVRRSLRDVDRVPDHGGGGNGNGRWRRSTTAAGGGRAHCVLQSYCRTHVGQESSACSACTRPARSRGCAATADWSPNRVKVSGAIQRQVSQSVGGGGGSEGRGGEAGPRVWTLRRGRCGRSGWWW
jgi:hypothetical protein